MYIEVEQQQIEVEKLYDRGWEGIVLFAAQTNRYFYLDLGWQGGGYVERVKEITETEYRTFRELGSVYNQSHVKAAIKQQVAK